MRLPVHVPLARSTAALAWERAVPAFLPLVTAVLAGLAIFWTGLPARLPLGLHLAALTAATALFLVLGYRALRRFSWPRRSEVLRRIEERSGLRRGILDGVWASPFASEANDPLWIASRERLLASIGRPRPAVARVSIARTDPYRLGYLSAALLAGALLVSRGSPTGLVASLAPDLPSPPPVIVDAWIEPPAYTGLGSQVIRFSEAARSIVAPAGSRLHLRVREEDGRLVRGVLTFASQDRGRRRIRPSDESGGAAVMDLTESGLLQLTARGTTRSVTVLVRPDRAPSVRLLGDPDTSTGVIRAAVETRDDYPLASARLILSLLPGQKISRDAPAADDEVVGKPESIPLPSLAGAPGERMIEAATEEHPWAGLLVKAQVEVIDGLGQAALSQPFAFTMPQRSFYNPLSQAVIEERRKLAMAPSSLNRSAALFRALVVAPDLFDIEPAAHLMMKATAEAVAAAKVRDVPDIIDSLWPLALELEDEGLTLAKARLDAAEDALRQALRDGASQDEIADRIAELRQAMDDYIRALAESGFAQADPEDGDTELGEADLDEILRQMQELSERGANAEAESLLAQLEALLQSLQLSQGGSGEGRQGEGQQAGGGQPGGTGSGESGEGGNPLSGTGDLIQKQRELADDTFSARRGDRGAGGLAEEQEGLAEALGSLLDELGGEGDSAREAFDRAGKAMEDAARALEDGMLATAQALQERALEALREAGGQLAEAMGEEGGDPSLGGADPLGRAFDGEGPQPEDFGLYDPERIRELISRIRRRLEDPDLGEAERRYLESLLERF